MTALPLRCVVDTNVATTANGANPSAPPSCVAASAAALRRVMKEGHVFIDDQRRILDEYQANLHNRRQPGPGDAFLKWLLTHEWTPERVTHVAITRRDDDGGGEDYVELGCVAEGTFLDRSDRKFLAVAAAHPEHPPVLQSFDSKWVGWVEALRPCEVEVHFVCKKAIERKHREKRRR